MYLLSILAMLKIITTCETSNILAVFPIPSKSHHVMFGALVKGLSEKGHNITIISPYKVDSNATNIKQIILHTYAEKLFDNIDFETIFNADKGGTFYPPKMVLWQLGLIVTKEYLKSKEIQNLIHSDNDKFDVILLETSFGQESLVTFGHKFNAPVVTLNSIVNFLYLDEFIGNPLSLAIVPHSDSHLTAPMTFHERLKNVIRSFVVLFYGYYFYLPEHEEMIKEYFNYTNPENIPPLVDMLKNISLAISNTHISIEDARPLVPNVIGGAGMHLNKNPPPLPKDLQKLMDEAKNGVIYFSFGTIIPSQRMDEKMKNAFLKAFSRLKQKVLWKANMDKMENLPENVEIAKWFPQQSVLAHPKCLAFITHGGLFSLQEAVYFGVPLIAVPMFGDQHINIGRAKRVGYAYKLDYKNLTEESIYEAVNEVLTNSSYRETANKYSKIFQDNPIEPLANAIYWIEYVIRYKGARHLRTQKLDQNFVQYLLIDVIAFINFVLLISIIILYYALKYFAKRFSKIFIKKPIKIKSKKTD